MTAFERRRWRTEREQTHKIRRSRRIDGFEIALALAAIGFAVVAWCC